MRKYFGIIFLLVSSIFILGGCESSEKKVTEKEYPLKAETEFVVQEEDTPENTKQGELQEEGILTAAQVINLSEVVSNNAKIYLRQCKSKEESSLSDNDIKQGEIVQLDEQGLEAFTTLMEQITLIEEGKKLYLVYPQYDIVLKDEENNVVFHIQLWEDGYLCINWMDYYKITGETDLSVIEDLFTKSAEVQILSVEEAFEKILPEDMDKSLIVYEQKVPTVTLDSGIMTWGDETFKRPYRVEMFYEDYYFDNMSGTTYRFPKYRVFYELDGKTIFSTQTLQGYLVDYITGEVY